MRYMVGMMVVLVIFVVTVHSAGYSPALRESPNLRLSVTFTSTATCAELCIPPPCNGIITDSCFCKDAVLNCMDGVCYSPTEYLQAIEAFGSYCPV
ncbi:uncharacterized protein SCHCODRAFT_02626284 [Schizophyllum commune H4-8]|uniref:uncharacterized protein n=1 Tax=Schizophyllum commune (strain H4-8 / FGSC 9210) TaxID=578458 RepID=UPI002160283C|nr:uncharacterized protein SCHCODRAFT_02626284 [Schizophyllum commune H4-8]KAI5892489.1 hypothetical protein SCHCODRAFT_02626284 [Schizophyllum commune H4-8]